MLPFADHTGVQICDRFIIALGVYRFKIYVRLFISLGIYVGIAPNCKSGTDFFINRKRGAPVSTTSLPQHAIPASARQGHVRNSGGLW